MSTGAVKTGARMTDTFTKKNTLSSRAKRGICFFVVALMGLATAVSAEPKRPKILGIAYVRIFSSNLGAANPFYVRLSAMKPGSWQESASQESCTACYLGPPALLEHLDDRVVLIADTSPLPNRLNEIVFRVSDAKKMERYVISERVAIASSSPRLSYFEVLDPEGHRIGFLEEAYTWKKKNAPSPLRPMIHAGFVVRDRAAMDKFYKDILGFHVYWHGGMTDDQTNWVDMQVPDGTDWIEYMLNVPADADQRTLGIMNHIALGVPDIHAAYKQLLTNGMKLTEEPKIGRDGKWQLNLYDPDQTRVELMEFKPVEKPCCSEYTGPHPKP